MEVFKVLKSHIGNERSIGIALDQEVSVINILKELFGDNVQLRLCFLNLRCCLSAKFREKGLKELLASEESKRHLALYAIT